MSEVLGFLQSTECFQKGGMISKMGYIYI